MTKLELIQRIKYSIKPEDKIQYYHINIIVDRMIEEIKKAIIGKQKIVINGLLTFNTKVVDEKKGVFLGKPYHCDKKMVGVVKLSKSFQKEIEKNSKVI